MVLARMEFNKKPVLIFWETTRACALSCKHCRASAIHSPLPGELTTEEGFKLINQITEFGERYPLIIFTGGDPLARKDLPELFAYTRKKGIKFAASPAVTSLLTHEKLHEIRDSGVTSISISLDSAFAETHDGIRGIAGTFEKTLDVLRYALAIGLPVQVNTTVMKQNISELPKIFHLIKELGVKTWEVFFLIKTGRGAAVQELSADECESVCNFLYDASRYGLVIRTVEAPFIRRVISMRAKQGKYWTENQYVSLNSELSVLEGEPVSTTTLAPQGTLDGDGIIFISHDGDIFPGGFLPLSLGNIKNDNLVKIYQENKFLKSIRNRDFEGKCGTCEFKAVCGGSRARAYAAFGTPLASDSACIKK
ncbi:MAG: TIGR04053 family radical SAM/SPASM domain-containing protein [Candidatus Parvarchaeota archaeon]|nr:TIGR04053 family radical SAM/SPASM domain-containing protein [Candidatus Parvarchaeota archaeon]